MPSMPAMVRARWTDLRWEGIDAFEITYSTPGLWIDEILVAVPA